MTIQERHHLGKESESLAADWFLSHKNARLLIKNYRVKCGEMDLIFEETLTNGQLELVFVEVRATSSKNWIDGAESISPWKQRKLKNTANHFLMQYRGKADSLRIDLLERNDNTWNHLPNIWI